MESILKIIGSEIYIGSFLFSSGLEGKAYAEKLREAEELERLVRKSLSDEYDTNSRISELECEVAELEKELDDANEEIDTLNVEIDKLTNDLEVSAQDCAFIKEQRAIDSQQIESLQGEVEFLRRVLNTNGVEIPEDFVTYAPELQPQSVT